MKEPQLYWSGKNDARRLAENDLCCTLHPAMPDADSLPKCRHLFLIGDNLTGLCFLERNSAPRADLIYIDPPYQAYDTTAAQWLSEIYLRLTLARVRMRPEALICISMNDRFQAELRLLCNEIFGSQNFVAQIVRKRTDIPPRTSRVVQRIHEYVLVFAKDIKQYLAIHTGPPVPTLWEDEGYSREGAANLERLVGPHTFSKAKPVRFIQKCIRFCPKKDAVVLDFYAGSATTAQAVLELNRTDGGTRSFQLIQRRELLPDGEDLTHLALRRIQAVSPGIRLDVLEIK